MVLSFICPFDYINNYTDVEGVGVGVGESGGVDSR